jgi:Flp pilus assembly pilin Flp
MTSAVQPLFRFLSARLAARKGQTLVEYALVLAVITIVLVTVFSLLSARIIVVFSAITTILDTAQAGSH